MPNHTLPSCAPSPPMLNLAARIRGSFTGLAVCDALGGPVEFRTRGSFPLVTELQPNGNFSLPAGCFTDDTSMALCLAHSLLANHSRHDSVDQVRRYLRWRGEGYMSSVGYCFDVGAATNSVLTKWRGLLSKGTDHSTTAAPNLDGGSLLQPVEEQATAQVEAEIIKDYALERYCGNGSLMRVVAVALIAKTESDARYLARRSSLITHPHPRCVQACEVYVSLVVRALQGQSKEELADGCVGFLMTQQQQQQSELTDRQPGVVQIDGDAAVAAGAGNTTTSTSSTTAVGGTLVKDKVLHDRLTPYSGLGAWRSKPSSEIRSSGYVVDSLEASLWAFFSTDSFEDGAVRVVNLGDDADTVGAIYGGLAGAFYGVDAIPSRWRSGMRKMDMVDEVVDGIVALREM